MHGKNKSVICRQRIFIIMPAKLFSIIAKGTFMFVLFLRYFTSVEEAIWKDLVVNAKTRGES